MTNPVDAQATPVPSDKEINFAKQRQMYEKQLEAERQERSKIEQRLADIEKRYQSNKSDDDDDNEPYVDKRKLSKAMDSFSEKKDREYDQKVKLEVERALKRKDQENWLKSNPDFHEVMKHADKLPDIDPELAESILEVQDDFSRQKLAYKTIKSLGIHKPKEEKQSDIQGVIDRNRGHRGYRPSELGTPGYAAQGDYSPQGVKTAYTKMKELQKNLRLG